MFCCLDKMKNIYFMKIIKSFIKKMFYMYNNEVNYVANYQNISAEEARKLLLSGEDFLFLDVRETNEYNSGNIKGAVNMPWTSGYLKVNHKELPDKKIIVYCASGVRSRYASQFLSDNAHSDIFNMQGGYGAYISLPPFVK